MLFPVFRFLFSILFARYLPFDVLACPDCGGRLRLLATIADRAVIDKILRHLDLPAEIRAAAPAREPPWLSRYLPGFDTSADRATRWPC